MTWMTVNRIDAMSERIWSDGKKSVTERSSEMNESVICYDHDHSIGQYDGQCDLCNKDSWRRRCERSSVVATSVSGILPRTGASAFTMSCMDMPPQNIVEKLVSRILI